ncbi:3-carboxy-cis,cis-mucoante lactonizing enzyme [Clavulina sp. PMI_390]|nr:3-carboxy-cis,cis-mucoante lactonizing enzyme [Clavulina sp. PMI_390]
MASSALDVVPETLYIITGSFSAIFLYILAFNTHTRQLSVLSQHDAFGPHQWLVLNSRLDRLYATSWAWPPHLYSWKVVASPDDVPTLEFINDAPISATSSYIALTDTHTYSIGGPSGEVHALRSDAGYGDKVQEVLYVSPEEFKTTDKTRKALREGSHGIEFTKDGLAFVPHLGTNSIWIYQLDAASGKLDLLSEVQSIREHDAPRHALPHPNGRYLYVVTEHTSFLDVYEISNKTLLHRQAASLIPADRSPSDFRGDTLRLSRRSEFESPGEESRPQFLFATTRGKTTATRGFLSALELDADGLIVTSSLSTPHEDAGSDAPLEMAMGDVPVPPSFQAIQQPLQHGPSKMVQPTSLWETPTSGGKANAISLAPYSLPSFSFASTSPSGEEVAREGAVEWLVLTDDEQGFVFIVEWDSASGRFEEVSRVSLGADDRAGEGSGEKVMASHAVWLA